jgi:mannose-1-phosphate guanylyltransferase/phosphomannomutase
VKVQSDDGWALVLPAPDEALTRVWAESDTEDGADRLADRYMELVKQAVAEDVDEET